MLSFLILLFSHTNAIRQYTAFKERHTWAEAKSRCESIGQELAVIDSTVEANAAFNAARSKGESFAWIGLTDVVKESEFKWVDGSVAKYFNWGGGQPDNFRGSEDCVMTGWHRSPKWNDLYCNHRLPYICSNKKTITKYGMPYVGCYPDAGQRDLEHYQGNRFTIQACRVQCGQQKFKYAGLQYHGQCFCGNSYGKRGNKVPDAQCNRPCRISSQQCGGPWRNSIYIAQEDKGSAGYVQEANEGSEAGYVAAKGSEAGYVAAKGSEAGYVAAKGSEAGYVAAKGQEAGYVAAKGQEAGYVKGQEAGYVAAKGQEARHVAAEGQEAGYVAAKGQEAGYVKGQEAGYVAAKGSEAGYVAAKGQEAGYVKGQEAGYVKGQEAGYVAAKGQEAGYVAAKGQEAGYVKGQEAGYVKGQEAGYVKGQEAGYVAAKGQEAGYVAAKGQEAGYVAAKGSEAGYVAAKGSEAGYVAAKGQEAGYVAEPDKEGEEAGYIPEDKENDNSKIIAFGFVGTFVGIGAFLYKRSHSSDADIDMDYETQQLLA